MLQFPSHLAHLTLCERINRGNRTHIGGTGCDAKRHHEQTQWEFTVFILRSSGMWGDGSVRALKALIMRCSQNHLLTQGFKLTTSKLLYKLVHATTKPLRANTVPIFEHLE